MANTTVNRSEQTRKMVQMAILVALILLLGFIPQIGYITIVPGMVSITLVMIPVIIGACMLGPAAGAVLGAFFGFTSFMQLFTNPGANALFIPLFESSPIKVFIICMLPRIMIGVVAGHLCRLFVKNIKKPFVSYAISGVAGALTNTVLFVGSLLLLFGKMLMTNMQMDATTFYTFWIVTTALINGGIEAVLSGLISGAVCKAVAITSRRRAL